VSRAAPPERRASAPRAARGHVEGSSSVRYWPQ
jgi:hypothetical protein